MPILVELHSLEENVKLAQELNLDFIELKVKDLQDDVQEKEIITNNELKINNLLLEVQNSALKGISRNYPILPYRVLLSQQLSHLQYLLEWL